VKLTVQDNGRGFDIADKNRPGMGIRIMRYRAKVVNAAMDLQSRPGAGTVLTCDFNPKAVEDRAKTTNE
jgi:nitrate/nitrite-specific signal transduction histidine kinase